MYVSPPCLLRAFQRFSPRIPCYKTLFSYISHDRLNLINITLPEECPSKRRLSRKAEQLGRYSEGSHRRFFPPRATQFPLRKTVQRGCTSEANKFAELDWIYSNPRSVSRYELSLEKTRC